MPRQAGRLAGSFARRARPARPLRHGSTPRPPRLRPPHAALGDIERQRRGRRGVLCVGGSGGHVEPPRPAPGGW